MKIHSTCNKGTQDFHTTDCHCFPEVKQDKHNKKSRDIGVALILKGPVILMQSDSSTLAELLLVL